MEAWLGTKSRPNRNCNLKISKALLKSQAHQGTSLFTSAATNHRDCSKNEHVSFFKHYGLGLIMWLSTTNKKKLTFKQLEIRCNCKWTINW